ncbi:MAG: GDSL-type esterase/lipase family protein [Acidobacteria bacterium]|nr:GDSL-type esterase/lipase family protein [Acidobacteriota bacterium]
MYRTVVFLASFLGLLVALACGGPASAPGPGSRIAGDARDAAPAAAASVPDRGTGLVRRDGIPRIVVLGDSLTAGLGLSAAESFPTRIQARLDREGYDYEVINAGVSGDTSAGGLRRLEWSLDGNPRILIVALGGNDGLRGLPVSDLKKNLSAIIERALDRGLEVILAGMEAPPNNGAQ